MYEDVKNTVMTYSCKYREGNGNDKEIPHIPKCCMGVCIRVREFLLNGREVRGLEVCENIEFEAFRDDDISIIVRRGSEENFDDRKNDDNVIKVDESEVIRLRSVNDVTNI